MQPAEEEAEADEEEGRMDSLCCNAASTPPRPASPAGAPFAAAPPADSSPLPFSARTYPAEAADAVLRSPEASSAELHMASWARRAEWATRRLRGQARRLEELGEPRPSRA